MQRAEIATLQASQSHVAETPLASSAAHYKDMATFKAFEQYRTVVLLAGGMDTSCEAKGFICADKMQAYDALGPKLNAVGYAPITLPSGYKVFDTTVK